MICTRNKNTITHQYDNKNLNKTGNEYLLAKINVKVVYEYLHDIYIF